MSDKDRRDDAVRTLSFKDWLSDQEAANEAEFSLLYGLLDGAPKEFVFAKYAAMLPTDYVEVLVQAESAWKIDRVAQEASRRSLGIALLPDGGIKRIVEECGFTFRTGRICGSTTVPGVDRCSKHGGALVSPEVRRAVLLSSYATIVEGSEKAVAALLEIVEHGRSEIARVQAATQLLDRAGLTADININVNVHNTVDAGEVLRERLNAVSGKVIEAEVVGESESE